MGSENLKEQDEIREAIKNGTLAIGFIGLAGSTYGTNGLSSWRERRIMEAGYQIIEGIKKQTTIRSSII